MPKVPAKPRTKTTRDKPITNPTAKPKDPKDSHLYTDDNPSTTIHGTGFKDKAAAERTLDLIKKRSLIYQFQTVNTMFHRAKHHPAMKKAAEGASSTADMRAAMDIFQHWLDVTYPAEKDSLRASGFKPLLSKKTVERYLPQIERSEAVDEEAKTFAKLYVGLGGRKRLGNVLVDDSKPKEADWEKRRYTLLDELVGEGKEEGQDQWKLSELWEDDREVAAGHLRLIAWAWSPVPEKKLP
ncbi:hypothetical protein DOTSEDRAFT_176065 [Dothistroma septosporum NZE10]|uniref:Uncharacterized protein n=1 Tax=Dothistroma septosporum (strain NZE10 / CBS 128990) TaxID=675120 RepID=N1PMP8_DOTSN|nr:hypothetical protein DOTSEDRAFT_176065 [Dothistroma septosporum NZE10]